MPRAHHGGSPLTKRQQHKKTAKDTAITAHAAGIDHGIHVEPWDHGRWERAVTTHTAGHAPAPTTGGTMSATEDAAALRAITLPFAAMQQAQTELDQAMNTASTLLGSSGTGLQAVQGAIQAAKQEIDGAYSMVQEVENQLEQAASGLTQG
ncbi:hypothetical protein [Amycolatopsis sp. NPDC049159]|uniref:hypothetical protein n=1 Tax=Amycolatopsis sp. NPDC049159 TaxID=3157210 RepID=UPI0033C0BE0B